MPAPGPLSSSRRLFTVLLAVVTASTTLSVDLSLPAMPQLEKVFSADVPGVQLTLSLFLLGYAVGQFVCGPLSDHFGRRPVLLAGMGLFTAASLACALSRTLEMLILSRTLQGAGASVGPILARAMVRDRFDARDSASVLSVITQLKMLVPLVAPSFGALLLLWSGWPIIFHVLTVCGALLIWLCWRNLPETLERRHCGSGEISSVVRAFRTVLLHRRSRLHILTVCFSYSGLIAYISAAPFVLMEVFQVERERFGLYFALTGVSLMAGAALNRAALPRLSPSGLLRAGIASTFAAGMLLALGVWTLPQHLGGILGPMMLYFLSLGIVVPNATAAAMEPHGRLAGVASSLIGGLQIAVGALAGYCVSLLYSQSAASLAAVVAVLSLLTVLTGFAAPPWGATEETADLSAK